MLTGPDFARLRAFIAITEAGNFSRAAATLGLSPSALSQTIRDLEAQLGLRLLNRTTRSMSLTDAGTRLLDRIRPDITNLDTTIADLRTMADTPSGTLRIHSFHSAAIAYIAPILGTFAQTYPNILLDIVADDTTTDLVAEGFDAGLRIGELIAPDLIAIPIGPEIRQIVVATPDYLTRYGIPQTPRDLTTHRCIRWRWPGHATPYRWEFCENGRWFEVAVNGPLIVNSKDLMREAALNGAGLAMVSEPPVRQAIAEGRLVPVLERWSAPFPGHFLCYPTQRQMAPALRAFIDTLRTHTTIRKNQ